MLGDISTAVYGVAKYLTFRDLRQLQKTAKLRDFAIFISAMKIWNFFAIKKTQEWVNNVIRQCLFKHPYYNRTNVNIGAFHIPCSLQRAKAIAPKKKVCYFRQFS